MTEVHLIATISLKRLILELLEVDELCLVDDKVVERHRVRRARAVLRDNVADRAVVEADGVLPVGRSEDGRLPMQFSPRTSAHDIMQVTLEPPTLEMDEH